MILELVPTANNYRQFSQDGTSHFTFYINDAQLSFIWDGDLAHPVEMEHGGYGEPLIAVVTVHEADLPSDLSATGWLLWFTNFCERAAETLEEALA